MCGYVGFVYTSNSLHKSNFNIQKEFIQSAEKISHRGNEKTQYLFLPNVFVSHSRLAFLDLSASSLQPIWSADREWFLIFNGEIYNYQTLRREIQSTFDYPFTSQGDGEVILAGFLHYKEKILDLLDGEYSFVIFKKDGSEIFAGRDPYGVKPLFVWCENITTEQFSIAQTSYHFQTNAMCFSSEIKGIFCKKTWNQDGFLRQATGLYEPIRTPFENIIHVPQGSFLWARKNSETSIFSIQLILNYSAIRKKVSARFQNQEEIYQSFHQSLKKSITDRTISDVELGVYLSGGIDSKTIAAYLSKFSFLKQSSHTPQLKSFTVGFDVGDGFDETQDAIKFAHAAGMQSHVCTVNYDDLSYAYPIAVYYSENIQPYTNGAAKWWLSRFTASHVRGVLTGDGADEVFCGYPSFRYAAWWAFVLNHRKGKNVFDKLQHSPLGSLWQDSVYQKKFHTHSKNPWLTGSSHEGDGSDFIESLSLWGIAHPLFGQIKTLAELFLGIENAKSWLKAQQKSVTSWFKFGFHESDDFYTDPHNTLLLWQNYFCHTHLPVQVLNWVGDRMEMANTLEGRPPFLSKQIKSLIYNLNDNFFVRGFEEKSILKRNFKRQFPEYSDFIPREKKQFNAPFLFERNLNFHFERIFEKLKKFNFMDDKNLKNFLSETKIFNRSSNYSDTFLKIALQTLISFTYVDDYLIQGETPIRDLNYEQKKIDQ